MPPKAEDLRLLLLTAKQQNNNQLTQELWLTTTQRYFDETWPKKKAAKTSTGGSLGDAEWVLYLETLPHLQGLDVRREIGKCQLWTQSKSGRMPSRMRIINWLNKAERPLNYQGQGQSSLTAKAPVAASVPEPKGWREAIKDHEDLGIFATRDWDSINPYYHKLIVRLST